MAQYPIDILLRLIDQVTAPLRSVSGAMDDFADAAEDAAQSAEGVSQSAEGLGGAADGASEATDALSGAARELGINLGPLEGIISGNALTIAGLATAAAGAVAAIADFVTEYAELGREVQQSEAAFRVMMRATGESAVSVDALVEATGREISGMEAMRLATYAMSTGASDAAGGLERLMRVGAGIGDLLGVDAVQGVDALTFALLSQSDRALRRIGVDIRDVERRTQELIAADQNLTEEQARAMAIMEEAERVTNELAEAMPPHAEATDRLAAAWRNYREEVGRSIEESSGLGAVLDQVADALNGSAEAHARANEYTRRGVPPRVAYVLAERDVQQAAEHTTWVLDVQAERALVAARNLRATADGARDAASGLGEVARAHEDSIPTWETGSALIDESGRALREAGISGEWYARVQDALALALGEITPEELEHRNRIREAARAYADGTISLGQYIAQVRGIREAWAQVPKNVTTTYQIVGASIPSHGGLGGVQESYQHGTEYVPATGLYLLHQSEAVLSPRDAALFRAALRQRGRGPQVNIGTINVIAPDADQFLRGLREYA